MTRRVILAFMLCATSASAQQHRFDDVIRNLRNPDPKVRLASVQLLHESRYPEAIEPIAPLVTDPVDQIQLEAIAAELSFFLIEDVRTKKRVAGFVEVRNPGLAVGAFEMGPLAITTRAAPPELVEGLLRAVDDENPKVRSEAVYALGAIAGRVLSEGESAQLIKALDHYDPVIRAGAARVIGRLNVTGAGDALLRAVSDSQAPVRYAALRALGEIHDVRAVQALTEQLNFYGKGEGAWSALDGLARIADPSSVPLFKARLADKDPFLRRAAAEGLGRAGDSSELPALEIGAGNDPAETARAAMAFALQKLGRNYVPRLVESLASPKTATQAAEYFVELGTPVAPQLLSHLQDPSPEVRANVAIVLGVIGDARSIDALQPLTQDKDRVVAQSAARAVERLKAPK